MARQRWTDRHWRLTIGLYLGAALYFAYGAAWRTYHYITDDLLQTDMSSWVVVALLAAMAVLMVARAVNQYQRARWF